MSAVCQSCGSVVGWGQAVVATPAEVEALRNHAATHQAKAHHLATGAKLLADTVRSWGWQSKAQESNGELVGRTLHELRARVAELEMALKPFGAIADCVPEDTPDGAYIHETAMRSAATIGMCRIASAALPPAAEAAPE